MTATRAIGLAIGCLSLISCLRKISPASEPAEEDLTENDANAWGDGGDVVSCNSSGDPAAPAPGYYSLDYFVTLGFGYGEPATVTSLESSLDRIEALLDEKVGAFGDSFRTFRRFYGDWHSHNPQFWRQGTLEIRGLNNPDVVDLIPENCRDGARARLIKMIKRNDLDHGRILYIYQPQVIDQISRDRPLQVSYLLVHEWTRFISNHPTRNRIINRFLHSSRIDEMSPEEVQAELRGMGVDL